MQEQHRRGGGRLSGDLMKTARVDEMMGGFIVGHLTELPTEFSSQHSLDTAPIAIPIFQMNRLRYWEVRRY